MSSSLEVLCFTSILPICREFPVGFARYFMAMSSLDRYIASISFDQYSDLTKIGIHSSRFVFD